MRVSRREDIGNITWSRKAQRARVRTSIGGVMLTPAKVPGIGNELPDVLGTSGEGS